MEKIIVTKEELLEDIKRVATKMDVHKLTLFTYKKLGKYSFSHIQYHFGTWNNAKKEAGFEWVKKIIIPRSKRRVQKTIREIIVDVKSVAAEYGSDKLESEAYYLKGKFDKPTIRSQFNTWRNLLLAAGLDSEPFSREEIIVDVKRVAQLLGEERLTSKMYVANGKFSRGTIEKTFGNWTKVLRKAELKSLRINEEEFLADIIEVAKQSESKILLQKNYDKSGKYSSDAIRHKFGSWKNAIDKTDLS